MTRSSVRVLLATAFVCAVWGSFGLLPAAHAEEGPQSTNQTSSSGGGSSDASYYGGVAVEGAMVDGSLGMLVGLRGGLIANKQLSVGVAGMMSVLGPELGLTGYRNRRVLTFGWAGPEVEAKVYRVETIDVSVRTLFAAGGLGHNGTYKGDAYSGTGLFFLFQPGVQASMDLSRYARLVAGLSYRLTAGVAVGGLSSSNMNGFGFNVGVIAPL